MTLRTRYWPEITAAAGVFGLDPILVEAIVVQESAGNTDAFRFEREFWNRYLKMLPIYKSANPRRVSSSYGLMQIMYQVAVERGYPTALPPEGLFVPELGLKWGCTQFAWLRGRMDAKYPQFEAEQRRRATIASYNGGFQGPDALRPRNASYADSVLRHYSALLTEHRA